MNITVPHHIFFYQNCKSEVSRNDNNQLLFNMMDFNHTLTGKIAVPGTSL